MCKRVYTSDQGNNSFSVSTKASRAEGHEVTLWCTTHKRTNRVARFGGRRLATLNDWRVCQENMEMLFVCWCATFCACYSGCLKIRFSGQDNT